MSKRISEYRFWLLFAGLAIALLVACSSGDSSPGNGSGGGNNDGAAEAMTHA